MLNLSANPVAALRSQPLVYSRFRMVQPDGAVLDRAAMEPFPLEQLAMCRQSMQT